MNQRQRPTVFVLLTFWLAHTSAASQSIRLADEADLSPDGGQLVFVWRGDIWTAPSAGGAIKQLTSSPARDSQPKFSLDGETIAFISDRTGSSQVYRVPREGGEPEQLTFHSEGCDLQQWAPDGQSLLIHASRDHFWRHDERFFLIDAKPRSPERLLFDAYGIDGRFSPDGKHLLFTREGERWWRKGYRGSRASQIWLYHINDRQFTQLCAHETEARWPLWHPDGQQFYYVSGQSGAMNLWKRNVKNGQEQQLTHFADDSVVRPCISANGKVIVFRHLFDFYKLEPQLDSKPQRIELVYNGDRTTEPIKHRILSSATDVSFSNDGLEVAFVAGGDLWVMDTVLREPRQITSTPEEEHSPAFAPDGMSIMFASDSGGASDIWEASRQDTEKYWWQNESFSLQRLTNDSEQERDLQWSPDGKQVAFVKGRGDLWTMDAKGRNPKRLIASWNTPQYDWSPDGKWIVYALNDDDFNRDIHLLPIDGSRQPFNLSRHPDDDEGPVWSPDGKVIAFTGRRLGEETDMFFVYLQKGEDEIDSRDRKLKEAVEKIAKARTKKEDAGPLTSSSTAHASSHQDSDNNAEDEVVGGDDPPGDSVPQVVIDFEEIDKRIRRVSIPDASELGLFWSHDSKRLAFTATIEGKRGTYTIEPPDNLTPKFLSSKTGVSARWIAQGNQIVWLADGRPGSLNEKGEAESYSFSAPQMVDVARRYTTAFDMCWRETRDNYYDGNLNNLNWDAIRRKYQPMARDAVDDDSFATVVNMMLGELNGSHLGFYATGSRSSDDSQWRETTAHFGIRFDPDYNGPGIRIRDVIRGGPADRNRSKLESGEILLSVDGTEVDPAMELTSVLNGRLDRDVHLRVRNDEGVDRDVVIRPISYRQARSLLYEQWILNNQDKVTQLSDDRFGYLHIRGMNMTSFYRFERELYSIAAGKDGLVIDVRENGGGSTTDHLLTVLTQPVHAITVPRGGGPGYPHDRKVYASWNKPIVVLCNQNSFSNAEIFSHAIKTLKRGKLVGVPTAGGVISTASTRIMDVGLLRKPTRGWFVLNDGQDMELNGAVPHHIIWPKPGDWPTGKDEQLTRAVEVLSEDVRRWNDRAQPELVRASQRRGLNAQSITWRDTGKGGAVAAGRAEAVAAGLEILERGGNAADAAAATLLALAVTDYGSFAIGGEVPLLIYDANSQKVKVLCGLGSAPLDPDAIDWYYANGIPSTGSMKAAPVPGAVDLCVTALKLYGTISLEEAVLPALRLLDKREKEWHADLARTLRKLVQAEQNEVGSRKQKLTAARDRFYKGDVAEELEAWYIETGSMLRRADLAAHETRVEDPVSINYRGYTIFKCGPWTQGPFLCQTLRLLEGFDLKEMGHLSADYVHVVTEALKLGFADRDEYYGDPRFASVPLAELLSDQYTSLRRPLIDMRHASLELRPGDPYAMQPFKSSSLAEKSESQIPVQDTTTCVVADRWGNVVAATPSCNLVGNKPGPSGVTQGNRLRSLNTAADHPNRIQLGKRPRITLTPTLVTKDDKPVVAISVAGGDLQDQTTLNVLLNHIEFGMLPEKAVTAPRFNTDHHQHSFDPNSRRDETIVGAGSLRVNETVVADVQKELVRRGHQLSTTARAIGHPVMIYVDHKTGTIYTAGDPQARRHAAALD